MSSTNNLTESQEMALKHISDGENIILTGAGGSGKSYLISVIKELYGKETLFVASTGIAAINIGGMTAHSLLSLPIGFQVDSGWLSKTNKKTKAAFKNYKNIKRIVVDEVSMIRADTLDYMDQRLQRLMKSKLPFGGLQVILVGDLLQLAPVVKSGSTEAMLLKEKYASPHCFSAEVFDKLNIKVVELTQVVRQADPVMKRHLEDIRYGRNLKEAVVYFNTNCNQDKAPNDVVTISTTNKAVDDGNLEHFNRNTNKSKIYMGYQTGVINLKDLLVPEILKLKVGLRVMTLANAEDGSYHNGSVGTVKGFISEDCVLVDLDNEGEVIVGRYEYLNNEYVTDSEGNLRQKVVGSFAQIPLKIAYYLTAHKSQGVSLDSACLDLHNCFSEGQAYVALSRLRSMQGMYLKQPLKERDIKTDKRVISFLEANKPRSQ